MLFINFLCLFYLMVLTRCHTISKSIASYKDIDEKVDILNDYQLDRVYKPRHERIHSVYRRAETGKTQPLVTTEPSTKSKEKTTPSLTSKHGKSETDTVTAATVAADTSHLEPKFANASIKPSMNLFRRIQNKFSRKNKAKAGKNTTKKRHKKHMKDDKFNFVGRDRRYVNIKPTSNYMNHQRTSLRHCERNAPKIKQLFDDMSTRANSFNIDRINDGIIPVTHAMDTVTYAPPYTSPIDKSQDVDELDAFQGTAGLETLLNKIKLHAMNIITEQTPTVNEIISNTVTETTFDADPLLHSITRFVDEPIIFELGNEESDLVDSDDNIKSTQAAHGVQDVRTTVTTMATNLEHKLQREIKYALKKAKNTLQDGISKACDQVKSVTWKIMHGSESELNNKMTTGIDTTKDVTQLTTTITPEITHTTTTSSPTTQASTKTTTTEPTTLTTLSAKTTKMSKGTTRLNRATSIGNSMENVVFTTEDEFSMLSVFEDTLAKDHEDNVMKILTIPTPANRLLSLRSVSKLSKRDTETLENLNLKEYIRKLSDGEGIPDEDESSDEREEAKSDKDREKNKPSRPSVEVYSEGSPTDVTETTIRELATPDNSYAGLSNKIHYREFINGYKHYLNFAKDLSKFDRKFSDRICYQAHRHHSVDDIGKFILTRLPPIPEWNSSLYSELQTRDKRHFFDNSDLESNDVTTKSEESWFRRHFNIFRDKPKKYHTEQKVALKTKDAVQKKIANEQTEKTESILSETEGLSMIWGTKPSTTTAAATKRTQATRWDIDFKPIQPASVSWREVNENNSTQSSTEEDISKENADSMREKLKKLDKNLNELMNKISKATSSTLSVRNEASSLPPATIKPDTYFTGVELSRILTTTEPDHGLDPYLNEFVSALVLKNHTGANRIKKKHSNSMLENPFNVMKLFSKSSHRNDKSTINESDIDLNEAIDTEKLQKLSRIKREKKDLNEYEKFTTPFSILFDQAALYPPTDDKFDKLGYVDLNLVAKPPTTSAPKAKKICYKKVLSKLKPKKKKKVIKDKKLGGKPRKERHSPFKIFKNFFKISQPYPDNSLDAKTEPDNMSFLNLRNIEIDPSLNEFMKQILNVSKSEMVSKPSSFYKVPTESTPSYNAIPVDVILHPIMSVTPEPTYFRTTPKFGVKLLAKENSNLYNYANKYTYTTLKDSPVIERTTQRAKITPTRFHMTLTPIFMDDLLKNYIKYKTESLTLTPRTTSQSLITDNPVLITDNPTLFTAPKQFSDEVNVNFQTARMNEYSTRSYDSDFRKYGISFHGLNNLPPFKDGSKLRINNYLHDEDKDESEPSSTTFLKKEVTLAANNLLEDMYNKQFKENVLNVPMLTQEKEEEIKSFQNLLRKKIYADLNQIRNFKFKEPVKINKQFNKHFDNDIFRGFDTQQQSPQFELENNNLITETNKYNLDTKPTESLRSSSRPYKTHPNYFNDFFNWNRDILSMEHITTPSIDAVMSTLNNATRPLDIIKLREDIQHMKNYLKYLTTRKVLKHTTPLTTFTRSLTPTKKQSLAFILKKSNNSDKIRRGSPKKAKFQSLDDLNEVVNNINKLYSESFKRPVAKEMNFSDLLFTPILKNDATTSSPMDVTLMAYDDNVDNMLYLFSPKPKKVREESAAKSISTMKTKVNPLPKQYFMTPIAMKPTEFDHFLKENGLDVQKITSPSTDLSDFEDQWKRDGSRVESKLMAAKEKITYPKKFNEMVGIELGPKKSGMLFNSNAINRVIKDPEKFKMVSKAGNIISSGHNQYAYLDDLDNTEYEEGNSFSKPLKIFENPEGSKTKRKDKIKATKTPFTIPDSLHFDITIIDIDDIMKLSNGINLKDLNSKASTLTLHTRPVTKQPEESHKESDEDKLDFSPVTEHYPDNKVPGNINKIEHVNDPKNKDTEEININHGESYKFEDNLFNVHSNAKTPNLNKTLTTNKRTDIKLSDQTDLFNNPENVVKPNKSKLHKGRKNKLKTKTNVPNKKAHHDVSYPTLLNMTLNPNPKFKNYHQTGYKLFKNPTSESTIFKDTEYLKNPKNTMKLNVKPTGYMFESTSHSRKIFDDVSTSTRRLSKLKPKNNKMVEKCPKGVMFSSNTLKYAVYFDDFEKETESNHRKAKLHKTTPTVVKNKYNDLSKFHTSVSTRQHKYDHMSKLTTTPISTTKTEASKDLDVDKIMREVLGDVSKGRNRRKAMWRKWRTTPYHKPDDNRDTKKDASTKTYSTCTNKWFKFLPRKCQKGESTSTTSIAPAFSTSVLIINTDQMTSSPIIMTSEGLLLVDEARKREQRGGDSLIYVVDVINGNHYKQVSSVTSSSDDARQVLHPNNVTLIFPAKVDKEKGRALLNKDDEIVVETPWSRTLEDNLPRFKPDRPQDIKDNQAKAHDTRQDQTQDTKNQQAKVHDSRQDQPIKERNQPAKVHAPVKEQPQVAPSRTGQINSQKYEHSNVHSKLNKVEPAQRQKVSQAHNDTSQAQEKEKLPVEQVTAQPQAEQIQRPTVEQKIETKSEPQVHASIASCTNKQAINDKTCQVPSKAEQPLSKQSADEQFQNTLSKCKQETKSIQEVAGKDSNREPSQYIKDENEKSLNVLKGTDGRKPNQRSAFQETGREYDFPWTAQINPQYHLSTIIRYPSTQRTQNVFPTTPDISFLVSNILNPPDFDNSSIPKEFSTDRSPNVFNVEYLKKLFPSSESKDVEPLNITSLVKDYNLTDLTDMLDLKEVINPKPNEHLSPNQHIVKHTKLQTSTPCCTISSLKLPSTKYSLKLPIMSSADMSRELDDLEKKVHRKEEFSHVEKTKPNVQKDIEAALDKIEAAEEKSLAPKKTDMTEHAKYKSTKPISTKGHRTTMVKTKPTKFKSTNSKTTSATKVQTLKETTLKDIAKTKQYPSTKKTKKKSKLKFFNDSKKVKGEISTNKNSVIDIKAPMKTTVKKPVTVATKQPTSAITTLKVPSKNAKQASTMTTTMVKESVTKSMRSELKEPKQKKSKRQTCEPYNTVYTARDVAALEVIVDLMKEPGDNAPAKEPTGKLVHDICESHPSTSAIQVHIGVPYFMQDKKRAACEPSKLRKVFSAKMSVPVDIEYQVRAVDDSEKLISTFTKNPYNKENYISPGMYLLVEDNEKHRGFALRPVVNRQTKQDIITSTVKTNSKGLSRIPLSKDYIQSINKQLVELYQNLSALDNSSKHIIKRSFENNSEVRHRRKINWEKVLQYIGHDDRVCNCKCRPNQPMCKACAASDAVMTELMFEFENLAKYMQDHCTEIQTFFWMNPTAGRKLRDLVQKIDKSINDYFNRVKGKCQGRTCSCVEKREFVVEDIVENGNKLIETSLLPEIEDLAKSLQQIQRLKLDCNEKFKKIVDHFIHISRSCSKVKKDKRSVPVNGVYSLDNINVNIICNNNGLRPDSSTWSLNDITTSDMSIFDYTDDEVKKKETSKSFKQIFKPTKAKQTKRDAIVQIEPPVVLSDPNNLWKQYLNDAKQMTTETIEPLLSVNVLDTNKIYLKPSLKATLVKIDDIYLNKTDDRNEMFTAKSRRAKKNYNKFNIDELTTKSESLRKDMKELVKLFESLPGGQEVKFTAGCLNRERATEKTTAKKDIEVTMVVKTIKDTSPIMFYRSSTMLMPRVSVTSSVSPFSPTTRSLFSFKDKITTKTNNFTTTQTLPVTKTTKPKENWFQKLKHKVVMITPPSVFDKNKTTKVVNINNSRNKKSHSNIKELQAVDMNANIHVNSDLTTTRFPTLFIIEDIARHATKNVDEKDSLLRNIINYEKDAIDSKLTKLKKRDSASSDNMFVSKQNKPSASPVKATEESDFAEGDYCLCSRIKELKSRVEEQLSRFSSTARVAGPKAPKKALKRKSLLSLFKKNKPNAGQQAAVDKKAFIKKEPDAVTSLPTLQQQSDERLRIKGDMDWFLAQFASTILFESSSIAYLDKLTESTPLSNDYDEGIFKSDTQSEVSIKNASNILSNTPNFNYTTTSSTTSISTEVPVTTTKSDKTELNTNKDSFTLPTDTTTKSPSTKTTVSIKDVTSEVGTTNSSSTYSTSKPTTKVPSFNSSLTTANITKFTTPKTTKFDITTKPTSTKDSIDESLDKLEKTIDANRNTFGPMKGKEETTPLTTKEKPEGFTIKIKDEQTTQLKPTVIKKTQEEIRGSVPRGESTKESTLRKVLNKDLGIKKNLIEACDLKTEACLCDIRATLDHIIELRRKMPKRDFERYVRNLTCHRYMRPPPYFLLEPKKIRKRDHQKQKRINKYFYSAPLQKSLHWDWIRTKRQLLSIKNLERDADNDDYGEYNENTDHIDDNSVYHNENENVANLYTDLNDQQMELNKGYNVNSDEEFEKLYKGEDNVYRVYKKRTKRTAGDMLELVNRLKDLPPLQARENELFAMLGDKMSMDCLHRSRSYKWDSPVSWGAERSNMLAAPDVVVDGSVVILNKVHARHSGNYTCSQDGKSRTVKLTVITLPQYFVVFIPMYASQHGCSYDDLRAIQRLGPLLSRKNYSCCRNSDSVKIDEPICLEDKDDGSLLLRATAILATCRQPPIPCSPECRRDLQSAFALLCAANAPVMYNIKVILARQGYNKTLVPSHKPSRGLIVTHTLRKKELQKHPEYHRLAASMYPGNLDIVVACPAGYSLLPKQKICVACPADTYAEEGENTCYACAAGTSSEPGSPRCRLSLRQMRRYDWWWYPPCGYLVAGVGVLCACVACTACALAAHVTSRSTARAHAAAISVTRADSRATRSQIYAATKRLSSASAPAQGGPPSPSAVILARFFRASASSSRVTDSQETKFEIWKEKNNPPPLPPIDFDLN